MSIEYDNDGIRKTRAVLSPVGVFEILLEICTCYLERETYVMMGNFQEVVRSSLAAMTATVGFQTPRELPIFREHPPAIIQRHRSDAPASYSLWSASDGIVQRLRPCTKIGSITLLHALLIRNTSRTNQNIHKGTLSQCKTQYTTAEFLILRPRPWHPFLHD